MALRASLFLMPLLCFAACASAPTGNEVAALSSGEDAKRAFLISDTADKFSSVNAGEAKDCQHHAMLNTLVGFGDIDMKSILLGASEIERKAANDVMVVWRTVFDRKSEAEKAEALETRRDRVEARQNGSLEKLSAEKCIHPVLAELGYEMVEA